MGDVSACTAIYPKVRQPSRKMRGMLDYQSSPDNKTTLNEVGEKHKPALLWAKGSTPLVARRSFT